jgi:hypothetical protein
MRLPAGWRFGAPFIAGDAGGGTSTSSQVTKELSRGFSLEQHWLMLGWMRKAETECVQSHTPHRAHWTAVGTVPDYRMTEF